MFRRMGLEDNLEKTKAMVCTPRFIWGKLEETAYKRRDTGEGATFREWKNTRVGCTMCGVMVASYYLKTHMARTHGIFIPQTRRFDKVGRGKNTYVVSFPMVLQEVKCLVPRCPEVAHIAGRLRKHFIYRNFQSKVAVVQ